MSNQFFNFITISLAFLAFFGIAEWLFQKRRLQAEHTRKIVHAGSGLLSLTFPFLFDSALYVAVLCSSFLGILYGTKKLDLLNSIHGVDRKTSGAFWFPAVVVACFASYQYFGDMAFFYLPILTLALADPAACLVGKKYPITKFNLTGSQKSLGGALGFFLVAAMIGAMGMSTGFSNSMISVLTFAAVTTLAELLGSNGSDNWTIPTAATLVLMLFYNPIILA